MLRNQPQVWMRFLINLTVQSANRSELVQKLLKKLDPIVPVFYVPEGQADDYYSNGAKNVVSVSGVMPMKPKQLNSALKDYHNDIVITMDDDFNGCMVVDSKKKGKKIPFVELVEDTLEKFKVSEFNLAGFSTTSNPFYLRTTEDENYGMLTGQIFFHKPKSGILFDENMNEMEDLEYIIQHNVDKGILKVNKYVVDFHVYGRSEKLDLNYSGGYSGYRTKQTEYDTYLYMRKKHPNVFKGDLEYSKTADIYKKIDWKRISQNRNSFDLESFL